MNLLPIEYQVLFAKARLARYVQQMANMHKAHLTFSADARSNGRYELARPFLVLAEKITMERIRSEDGQ